MRIAISHESALASDFASAPSQRVWCALALVFIGACSKERAQPANPPLAAPLASQNTQAGIAQNEEIIASDLVAAGMPASYRATFAAGQLQRIAETRAALHTGEYEFRGARLMRYAGAALSNGGAIELRFDLQGGITMSTGGSGQVPAEEISAIRTRAQLLRSHALAQRASRSHQPTM